jgi:hypothetical protein
MPASYRIAKSLDKLRSQVNAAAPHRSKASDGWIGDKAHFKKGSASDHNPWVDGGVVTALDITHDPARGCDAEAIAEALIQSKDKRIKYIIWDRQIVSSTKSPWKWRTYTGANPHNKHVHISVVSQASGYDDTSAWAIGMKKSPATAVVAAPSSVVPAGASLAWGKKVSKAFKDKVVEVAARLLLDPNALMAVMAFESARTFSPSIKNPLSGATGLIQFMPKTAVGLGTTTKKLAAMSAVAQLDYVELYLRPYRGKMADTASAYMAVLWPKAVPQPLSYVLFQAPTTAYKLNKGLDGDLDGKVTKAEAAAKVMLALEEGMRPENYG